MHHNHSIYIIEHEQQTCASCVSFSSTIWHRTRWLRAVDLMIFEKVFKTSSCLYSRSVQHSSFVCTHLRIPGCTNGLHMHANPTSTRQHIQNAGQHEPYTNATRTLRAQHMLYPRNLTTHGVKLPRLTFPPSLSGCSLCRRWLCSTFRKPLPETTACACL